jgi:hypothetical protein
MYDWITTSRKEKLTGLFQTNKKKHCYTGSTRNWNLYSVLGNSEDRSSVRVTQACDPSAPLALGMKLCLCDSPHFSPPHFKTYITVESYCWFLVCFPHSWAGRSQGTMEITQMAPVRPKFPHQESMLRLTGAWLPGDSTPREEQSETEFCTRNHQTLVKYLN